MTRYIAFLGGINVGGHRVKMDQLRTLFEELGLSNVGTYIASGNIFFDADTHDTYELERQLEAHLESNLGYAVPTFIRTIEQIEKLINEAPFDKDGPRTDERFCVVFSDQRPEIHGPFPIQSSKQDMEIIAVAEKEIFIIWRIINGRPPSGSFEKGLLPKKSSTRFFHTLKKILVAAKSA